MLLQKPNHVQRSFNEIYIKYAKIKREEKALENFQAQQQQKKKKLFHRKSSHRTQILRSFSPSFQLQYNYLLKRQKSFHYIFLKRLSFHLQYIFCVLYILGFFYFVTNIVISLEFAFSCYMWSFIDIMWLIGIMQKIFFYFNNDEKQIFFLLQHLHFFSDLSVLLSWGWTKDVVCFHPPRCYFSVSENKLTVFIKYNI